MSLDHQYHGLVCSVSVNKLHKCFDDFDQGQKGWLSRKDLKFAITALVGFRPGKFELEQIMERFGETMDGDEEGREKHVGLKRDKFVQMMKRKLENIDKDDMIRSAFCAFDISCRGFLTFDDTLQCFRKVLPHVSPKVVLDVFQMADRDRDGRVGFAEFVNIVSDTIHNYM